MSSTALGCAFVRAFHFETEAGPIFADGLAGSLFTEEERRCFEESACRSVSRQGIEFGSRSDAVRIWINQLSVAAPQILVRGAYSEEVLERVAGSDNRLQYVILGAGYDTFAWRRPSWSASLPVYELDRAEVQRDKRVRLARAGVLGSGDSLALCGEFGSTDWTRSVVAAGLDSRKPVFVTCCGLLYYLSLDMVVGTMAALAHLARTVDVVLDYWDASLLSERKSERAVVSMFESTARGGEPMHSGLDPQELWRLARGLGFEVVEDLGPYDLADRYFHGRLAPCPIGRLSHLRLCR